MTRTNRDSEGGFTLLEVLVAMALLGLLSTMLLGSVRLATQIMQSSRRHSDAAVTVPSAYDFLRTQIAQTLPIQRENLPPGERIVDFDGSPESLRIVTLAPSHLPPAAMSDNSYQFLTVQRDETHKQNSVVITWQPYSRSDGKLQQIASRRSLLLEEITALEISYFGSLDSRQTAVWHREWKHRSNLPTLVRIRFSRNGKDALPDLVVALPLANNGL